jgi:hypothetical protein
MGEAVIRLPVRFRVDSGEGDEHFDAEVRYDPGNPLAVTVELRGDDGPVPWTFGRDLLLAGLAEPEGLGDVRVWPTGGRLMIRLESHAGTILLSCCAAPVAMFLTATMAAVPPGTEYDDARMQREIGRLLDAGGRR